MPAIFLRDFFGWSAGARQSAEVWADEIPESVAHPVAAWKGCAGLCNVYLYFFVCCGSVQAAQGWNIPNTASSVCSGV